MSVDLAFIGTSVGFGGIAGFLIGYAIKKAIKIMMIIVGLFFAALGYLNYQGIVTINWDKLGATATGATSGLGNATGQIAGISSGRPDADKFRHTSHREFCRGLCVRVHERLNKLKQLVNLATVDGLSFKANKHASDSIRRVV
jgi:uncharacterized membrane protein (Fun14 family)